MPLAGTWVYPMGERVPCSTGTPWSAEPELIDWDEAVRIVSEAPSSEHLGKQALEARHARGLGLEGHQALASRSGIQRRNT